ncbi:MAG: oligosaccharide flippase family protein, partial [Oscillospiraceae bacterium]|nr:oligosaccharide flippase family protein [Oscillospiraceae bacterium]
MPFLNRCLILIGGKTLRTLGTIKNNSIKTNAILNIINAVANTVFPLIIYPYVSRCIGPDGVGKVSFFFSYANYFSLAAALGLSTYGVREVARQKANPDALRKTVSELFTINIVLSALFVSVYVISSFAFDRFNQEPLLIIICAVSIATPPLNMGWFFCGLEQYGHITKINAYIKIVTLVLSFLLINSAEDYWIYALVLAFAPVCSDIYYFFYARKLVKPCFLITRTTLSHLKPLIILFGSTLAVSVYTNLDTVMLGLISGDREVGLYSTAVKVKSILLMAVNAVSIVTLPRLSSYFAEKKMNEYRLVVKNTVSTVLMITIPFIVFFIVQSLNVVVIL